jgi:hypothetical protein
LLNKDRFWQHLSNGLAVFVAKDRFRYYRLPIYFEPFVHISGHFHIKPLLPMLTGNGLFFILALSQNQIRLLEATRDAVDEVDLEGVPESLAEALRWDDPEKQLQWHSGTASPSVRGERPAQFHGHGVGHDDDKSNILRFFHKIDSGIADLLSDGVNPPLVLAGVEYLHPLYSEANTHKHLLEEGITGNPEQISAEELHQKAWDIVSPIFQQEQQEAAERLRTFLGQNASEASNDLAEIVKAAAYKRVAVLFVPVGVRQWGRFDRDSAKVELGSKDDPNSYDLLDFAAANTFLNGGTVYAVQPDEMPEAATLSAIFRY